MNSAISLFGCTELPGWPGAFLQKFNIILLDGRKSYAPNRLNMQTEQCSICCYHDNPFCMVVCFSVPKIHIPQARERETLRARNRQVISITPIIEYQDDNMMTEVTRKVHAVVM